MPTHRDIIKAAGGATRFAERLTAALGGDLTIEANTVHGWVRTDSIPSTYWKAATSAALATFEELSSAAEDKLRRKGPGQESAAA